MHKTQTMTASATTAHATGRARPSVATTLLRTVALAAGLCLVHMPPALAQSTVPACQADAACWSSRELAVFVRSVSTSAQGGWKHVNVSLRLFNRSDRPTALAYMERQLIISDNRSHRSDNHGRTGGMPRFEQGQTQTNFRLEPGEYRDATIEFNIWTPRAELGDLFEISMLVREVRSIGDTNRVEGGVEHAIVLPRLREGTYAIGDGVASGVASSTTAPPAGSATPRPATAAADPCKGQTACATDGPLQVQVVRVGSTTLMDEGQFTDPQLAVVSLKIRNGSDKPVQLVHKLGDSRLQDSAGNAYPEVAPPDLGKEGFLPYAMKDGKASSELVVLPGATRTATLIHVMERSSKARLTDRFQYELELAEVDPDSRKAVRDFTVKFNGVAGKLEIKKRKQGFEKFKDQQAEDFEKFKNQ